MEISNFLHIVWNVDLPENLIGTNEVFPNKNDNDL